jgi:outer membrane receptor protein involved in Fe transport
MKWRDIQQILFLPTCGFDVVGNLGAAVSKGGEFDIDALIVPGLTFHTGVVYNDAYVTQTAPGTGAQLGDPIENAPKVTVSTAMDLSIPLGSSSSAQGLAHIDYQFHDSQAQSFNKTYQSTINPITGTPLGGLMTVVDPSYLQRSYSTSSASMGVRDGHWTVRLVVQNLLNAHPLLAMSSNGELANSSYTLLPRTFVIAVHAEY